MNTIRLMLKEQPSLLRKLTAGVDLPDFSPEKALSVLQQKIAGDFPALEETDFQVRYVHESMEDYLSPAFYLTPPLDTGSPNVIYINRSGRNPNLELFTTLAHEGFPGHLYQTVYFASCRPSDIAISSAAAAMWKDGRPISNPTPFNTLLHIWMTKPQPILPLFPG